MCGTNLHSFYYLYPRFAFEQGVGFAHRILRPEHIGKLPITIAYGGMSKKMARKCVVQRCMTDSPRTRCARSDNSGIGLAIIIALLQQ